MQIMHSGEQMTRDQWLRDEQVRHPAAPQAADGNDIPRMDDTPPRDDEQAKRDEFWFWVGVIVIVVLVFSYLAEMFPVPWFEG
jgi:hypothetical protein